MDLAQVDIAQLLTGGGLGAAVAAVIYALVQRRKVGADATAVVTAAARELVDPLRKELALERAEHAAEIEIERKKVHEIRGMLDDAMGDVRELRKELTLTRLEMNDLRTENARYKRRIRELEARPR